MSVAGKSVDDTTPARAYQPVRTVDATGTPVSSANAAQGATSAGQMGSLDQGAVTTASPTYTTGTVNPLSLSTRGGLRVEPHAFNATAGTDHVRTVAGADGTGAGVQAVATSPHSVAGGAVTITANAAVGGSIILKASAGNLYGFNCQASVAGYLMIFDSATVPADGAVTPKRVYQMAAGTSVAVSLDIPRRFINGIVLVFSTTGPFTKTISATAFLSGEAV